LDELATKQLLVTNLAPMSRALLRWYSALIEVQLFSP